MKPRKDPEAGFAVLMIYSMAAIVAIMLFMQLPRVAFEAQREKEQLLIDRGEQYTRAVQLYVRKFNKFPPDFDALNNTQNLRFLRRKYKDPMTGKDDWRIVHVGPGGVFTDSLIHKKTDTQQKDQQNFITEIQQTGGNPVDPNQAVNVATRQRPSDQPGAPGDLNNPAAPPPQFDPNGNPTQVPPGTVLPNGLPVPSGQIPGQPGQAGIPGQPGIPGVPGQPGFPFQTGQFNSNGTPTAPGQPFPGTMPQQFQQSQFQQSQFQQFNQQLAGQIGGLAGQAGGPPNGAAGLINQLLTTPRPGGLNGLGGAQQGVTTSTLSGPPGTPVPTPTGQTVIGGGIAGVASKLELDGIKVYHDQTSYNKWEFVYDITKDPARTGAAAIPAQNGVQPQNGVAGAAPGSLTMPAFGGSAGPTSTTGQAPPPPPPPPPPPAQQ